MKNVERVQVYYHNDLVGTLQQSANLICGFQYSSEWLRNGFSISPFSLPLEDRVFTPEPEPFSGLFGVFDDSLPDGWGRLLMDRMLISKGIVPESISPLTRLAIVGKSGRGALEYQPDLSLSEAILSDNLDKLCHACENIYSDRSNDSLDRVFQAGGSSGGARPKVNWLADDGSEWIVKFPCSDDGKLRNKVGKMEYDYSLCAQTCSIHTPEVQLIPSSVCNGFFASKRFDRNRSKKIHMVSVGGLLECSYRIPCLDYSSIIKLTGILTHQRKDDLEQIYRVMCFNFAAHNTDDHAKNFAFLFNDANQQWQLSPAYDLIYADSYGDEHMTALFGEGVHPAQADYEKAADLAGISRKKALEIQSSIEKQCQLLLHRY
jgi:serine/threonine-protein kinase HipA